MSFQSVSTRRLAAALVFTAASALAQPAFAATIDFSTLLPANYDNTGNVVNAGPTTVNNQTTGLIRDVWWWSINNGLPRVGSGDYINDGKNLVLVSNSAVDNGSGAYDALNFTGPSISGGMSYLAVYDDLSIAGPSLFSATGGLTVEADLMFVKHAVSAGVTALWSSTSQDGFALLAKNGDGNNADAGRLSLVLQNTGTGTVLATTALPSGAFCNGAPTVYGGVGCSTTLNEWYRVVMNMFTVGDTLFVEGFIYSHQDQSNPGSALGPLITQLQWNGALSGTSLANPGQVGLIVQPNEDIDLPDNVGVSFYLGGTRAVPEPSTMVLLGTGLLLVGRFARRKRS